MSRHRAPVRPRYGRIAVLLSALMVTGVAVLGGAGVLPGAPSATATGDRAPVPGARTTTAETGVEGADPELAGAANGIPQTAFTASGTDGTVADRGQSGDTGVADEPAPDPAADTALPEDSGTGRRVVFSEGRQRVWLVEARDTVVRTYPVSGSVHDNLDPGTYSVYSRSEHAYGIDDSGTMRWFVRFARGERAAIGFHDIPVDDGERVQTIAQLGTPLSHGCIRQRTRDARALWEFAPLGTTVVVTP